MTLMNTSFASFFPPEITIIIRLVWQAVYGIGNIKPITWKVMLFFHIVKHVTLLQQFWQVVLDISNSNPTVSFFLLILSCYY